MQRFELCFPDGDGRYLVPQLLEHEQPVEAGVNHFPADSCLQFEYRYPILPIGLLPRFVVRNHSRVVDKLYWRTGAILRLGDNRALVKADGAKNKVTIAVEGPQASRRFLLNFIRHDFGRIHAELSGLEPDEWVPLPEADGLAEKYSDLLVFEREGELTLRKVVQGKSRTWNVKDLLDGVDIPAVQGPLKMFISYSHKDERLRREFDSHLESLNLDGVVEGWHDRMITAGDEWRADIERELEAAHLIVLLVSSDFISSKFCREVEMTRAMERHDAGTAAVIPVIVRACKWETAPFAKLLVTQDGKPVKRQRDRDEAWKNVTNQIEAAAKNFRSTRRERLAREFGKSGGL